MRPGAYYRALLAKRLGMRPGHGWSLDLGAGDGTVLGHVGTEKVVALDPAPRQGVVRGDGTALPFACSSFSTVFVMDVLEHVADDGHLWQEVLRVTAPGATIWLTVPSREMRLFPAFLTPFAHAAWGHRRPGYGREDLEALAPPGAGTSVYCWDEPAYRTLYPVIWLLARLAHPLARVAVRAAFWYDARHWEGDQGHLVCRIVLP